MIYCKKNDDQKLLKKNYKDLLEVNDKDFPQDLL
jgi:hypothetical protein